MERDLFSRAKKAAAEPVAVDEQKIEAEYGPSPVAAMEAASTPVHRSPHKRFWHWLVTLSLARKLIYSLLLILIICSVVLVLTLRKPEPVVPSFPVYHAPTSNTVPSTLTGLQVDPAINRRQVTGVMIENSVFARPQSGLNQAGVVYEAVAEAGITRFLALFQDTQSNYLGPVRSARPYFVQWCQAFDCALAHVGGSPEALGDIKKWHVKNLDQFAGAQFFHRINSRYAPHNMYTSESQLTKYEKSRSYNGSSYTGFAHLLKEPKVLTANITTTSINFNYPGSAYDVHYSYNAKANDYPRSEGGKPHYSVDGNGKKYRNEPKVVIALVMHYAKEGDGYHSSYVSTGSGAAYIFQNGTVTKGTWSRQDRSSNFVLQDATDNTIRLTPGQTWISVVSSTGDISYK